MSAPGALKTPQERSRGLQDGLKSAPGGFKTAQERSRRLKTAPRAFQEASRRLQEHTRRLKTAQECSGRLQDDSAPYKLLKKLNQVYLGMSGRLRVSSASPTVGVQKYIRRNCSFPLSSNVQASGQLAPCMAMHGFTLVYISVGDDKTVVECNVHIYIYMYIFDYGIA